MGRETDEMRLARQVDDALDKNSFQPWAFSAATGRWGADIEMKFISLVKEVLKGWKTRKDIGLCNYPSHHVLAAIAEEVLPILDKYPSV